MNVKEEYRNVTNTGNMLIMKRRRWRENRQEENREKEYGRKREIKNEI